MFKDLISYWHYGNTYCSIEYTTDGGQPVFYGLTAEQKKGEYRSLEPFGYSSVRELSEVLPKRQHCFLAIDHDGVLVKETPLRGTDDQMIAEVFAGTTTQDFYFDVYRRPGNAFVAFCRKKEVDSILKQFREEKLEVIGFRLGFGTIANISAFIPDGHIATARYFLEISDGGVDTFDQTKKEVADVAIEDVRLPSSHLIALGGLLEYQNPSPSGTIAERNTALREDQHQKVFFRKGSMLGIIFLFIVTLANSLVFSNYFDRATELQEQYDLLQGQRQVFVGKKQDIEQKQRTVDNILNGTSKGSFYVNRLVASQPESILLSKLTYQPLAKGIRPNKVIAYTFDELVVEGQSNDRDEFNRWMGTLEGFGWVGGIEVSDYSDSDTPLATFSISLKLVGGETEK